MVVGGVVILGAAFFVINATRGPDTPGVVRLDEPYECGDSWPTAIVYSVHNSATARDSLNVQSLQLSPHPTVAGAVEWTFTGNSQNGFKVVYSKSQALNSFNNYVILQPVDKNSHKL